jgi:hypothetical protein
MLSSYLPPSHQNSYFLRYFSSQIVYAFLVSHPNSTCSLSRALVFITWEYVTKLEITKQFLCTPTSFACLIFSICLSNLLQIISKLCTLKWRNYITHIYRGPKRVLLKINAVSYIYITSKGSTIIWPFDHNSSSLNWNSNLNATKLSSEIISHIKSCIHTQNQGHYWLISAFSVMLQWRESEISIQTMNMLGLFMFLCVFVCSLRWVY